MSRRSPTLRHLAELVSDGASIDWNAVEASLSGERERQVAAKLRALSEMSEPPPVVADAEMQSTAASGSWGHLAILEKIDEGRFSQVFRARDLWLDHLVALKLIRQPGWTRSAPAVISEAHRMAQVRHPNVARIYGAEAQDGSVGLWMELIEGETLENCVLDRGPMSPAEATAICVDLCRALAAVYDAGFLHCDLKARNVMRERGGRTVLMDFGIGRPLEDCAGSVSGTPLYMAPELLAGGIPSLESEIYSLGVLLFFLLTGTHPVYGKTIEEIAEAHARGQARLLADIRPDLPNGLVQVVEKALSSRPANRFHSPGEMEKALRSAVTEVTQALNRGRIRRFLYAGIAVLLLSSALFWTLSTRKAERPESALAVVPLTSSPAWEFFPTFSPDGSQVAFQSNGNNRNQDIYVKLVGSEDSTLRLTDDPRSEYDPAWSPDNRWIAFVRWLRADRYSVVLKPPIGGLERPLTEVGRSPGLVGLNRGITWHPAGEWLVLCDTAGNGRQALYRVSITSEERRQLTFPPAEGSGDADPAFSPDGRWLAFTRFVGENSPDVHLLALTEELTPLAMPKPVTKSHDSQAPVWAPDGRDILFVRRVPWAASLWRVAAFEKETPHRVPITSQSMVPAVSPSSRRLAYAYNRMSADLWEFDKPAPGARLTAKYPAPSTFVDMVPQYSPDGSRIAFQSARSGSLEIWACQRDGSKPIQLTGLGMAELPAWSPDGGQIVLSAIDEEGSHVYQVNSYGGNLRRLTSGRCDNKWPSYSRDGRWIYFGSNRSGSYQVWKSPVGGGGQPLQVTANGGTAAIESTDGKLIYYLKRSPVEGLVPLWKARSSGGDESQVLESVCVISFAVFQNGIYFVPRREREGTPVDFYDFATGKTSRVLSFPPPSGGWGFSVSPDERSFLVVGYNRQDVGSDLMMAEDFR
ncbi:MAG: serine/threonine-protein kinase [Acidobacteria bacterium]|nr:MAG: serine/threonine-protein kinase [Acidobacteriota bacterium]